MEEKRTDRRQDLAWGSLIVSLDGSIVCGCKTLNVSASGAKLVLKELTSTPDEFVLMLSTNGAVQRLCQVVRRSDKEIGVKFIHSSVPLAPPSWEA